MDFQDDYQVASSLYDEIVHKSSADFSTGDNVKIAENKITDITNVGKINPFVNIEKDIPVCEEIKSCNESKEAKQVELHSSSTFINETKSKIPQMTRKIPRDRPQTTIVKVKPTVEKVTNSVNAMKLPHQLGQLPKYLRKGNLQSASTISSFSKISTTSRPQSIDSAISKEEFLRNIPLSNTVEVLRDISHLNTQDHNRLNEIDELNKKISTLSATLQRKSTKVLDLENSLETLKKELNQAVTANAEILLDTKGKTEKIKTLESRIFRMTKDLKQTESYKVRIEQCELEIAKLTKSNEEISKDLKTKEGENLKLKYKVDSFKKDLPGNKGDFISSSEYEELKKDIEMKESKIVSLNKEKNELIEELKKLKFNFEKSSKSNHSFKSAQGDLNLDKTIAIHKKREEELIEQILALNSQIEDARCANVRNEKLLEMRAEHIGTLQDIDNVNKTQLVLQAKKIEDYRKMLTDFEKFRIAHAEEKKNFEQFLKNLEEENIRLKTTVDILNLQINRVK